jgi:hypothetical protein
MHRIERRDIRATRATALRNDVGKRPVDATSQSSRPAAKRLATGARSRIGKMSRTKKNSLETEVSKLSF